MEMISGIPLLHHTHDFIMLSATHFDFADNNPPDESVVEMVHRWNEEGREPAIEFVTSDQLADELHRVPAEVVPRHRGDWPDFWNFGCASSARETRINRETKARLATLERLCGPLEEDNLTIGHTVPGWGSGQLWMSFLFNDEPEPKAT